MHHNIVQVIQDLVINTVAAQKPVQIMYGCVTDDDPLAIRVDQRLNLSTKFITVLNNISLETGDKVVLLRQQGGQRYIVLGRC